MTEPFDSFDEFDEPATIKPSKRVLTVTVGKTQGNPEVPPALEEIASKSKRGRGRKKVDAPVEIPANVPALEE